MSKYLMVYILLVGYTVSSLVPFEGTSPNLQSTPHDSRDGHVVHITPRSAVWLQTCNMQERRALLVALNEVAVWSLICVQRFRFATDPDMSLVWSVFRHVPQDIASREIMERRYTNLANEIETMGYGHVRFACGRQDWMECENNPRILGLNLETQTIVLVC